MKERFFVRELPEHLGQEVVVAGWLHRLRDLNKFGFAILRDRTGLVQVVLDSTQLEQLKGLQLETVLKITGTVVKKQSKDPQAEEVEVQAKIMEVLSPVTDVLPIEINKDDVEAQLDSILDHRVTTLRNLKQRAIFRVQAALVHGYRAYMERQGFTEIFFPVLAGAASEGGAEFFKVDYYGREAMLTQSAQLYKQMMVGVYEGVYGLSYSFRAEKFATSRHLTEFNQFEFEVGFVDGMEDIMAYAEASLREMLATVERENTSELKLLNVTLPPLGEHFPCVRLKEALQFYKEGTGIDETKEPDLSPAAEKWLSTVWAPHTHGSGFVFVTHYPTSKRPFYTAVDPQNSEETLSFDLIGFGSEIISGGLRVHRYDEQVARLKAKGLNPADFEDYLAMHKYGIPPEGGFGMGLQRLTQNILGLANIKEATIFPRDVQRLRP
ncbi:TPA: aspartate--tRNA(Asn) ligase [Candidatus Uhrbacteria bacterium]|uniref:Aspartyl-tRNA synthetase n=2 Tax=Candidatus Uhriibacteriota TaxID=1752732 RepID=A0A0G1SGL2_9BACT|nr:MAG: Aspartyl-tRNA synthetase [Candidatus Uhrbacteria bacterium GW2011_GWF2_46_218]KKU41213.1 MAG: Aspartyl-tRNA synthetase [Candidatus Uhrbacteria bacterium GW2011_GWE2_46_68]HBK34062.1 aspartate--tRNA(Asn) ligase [Candidatus Uhrbacteria bacterium]HCB18860.1 aspartate--tRNA(Asn) ligase [Candidatus Uhrbacteria bacterium]